MQLVDNDGLEVAELRRRVGIGQQQGEALRRRQQNVGWFAALALTFRLRRVAGAGLQGHRQVHLGNRRFEIAVNVDRQRLQRRDVERVEASLTGGLGNLDQGRQEAGQRLAAAGGRDQQSVAPGACRRHHLHLVRMRGPMAVGEPIPEDRGQSVSGGHARGVA